MYLPCRDSSGNVTGYQLFGKNEEGLDSLMLDRGREVRYGGMKNKTNFDFSGYFGYWGLERAVPAIATEYYAYYQLTAFGMMGATSSNLPLALLSRDKNGKPVIDEETGSYLYLYGQWELDSRECPVSYVDGTGRKTVIRYVD